MIPDADFKNKIGKMGRQFDIIIYYSPFTSLYTEDEKFLLSEGDMNLLSEQEKLEFYDYIDSDEVWRLSRNNLGSLFSTYMKSFDLETPHEFSIGQKLLVRIGVKIETDISYSYADFGIYTIYQKEYNEDNKTYVYTICDDMIRTMIPFKLEYIFAVEGQEQITVKDAIRHILMSCGQPNEQYRPSLLEPTVYNSIELTDIPNGDKVLYRKTFEGLNLTCRDVLDMLMQCTGTSLVVKELYDITPNPKIQYTYIRPSQTVGIIDDDIIRDTNVKFEEKFGPINSLLLSRADGNDNIERKDDESINTNGLCQYVINNNLILEQENRDTFIDALYNEINGLEYYTCNFDCTGVMYINYLDRFTVSTYDNTYYCLCLKNTFELSNGLIENFTSEPPQEKATEYTSGGVDDKTASILLDKLNGTMVLKTDNEGRLAQVRLDSSVDEQSIVEINADSINLNGYTKVGSGFSVDLDGNMIATSGDIGGWQIQENALYKDLVSGNTVYRLYLQPPMSSYTDDTWVFSSQKSTDGGESFSGLFIIKLGGDIFCKNLYYENLIPQSLEEQKKNFEKLKSGLDIIKDIDIYKFNYKDEEDTNKKHIGAVIGEDFKCSKEITANDEKGIDLYSMISVCCKAIQEQQEEIENLKKELEEIKNGRD